MNAKKERTLQLTCYDDEPISKKQLLCFVHNLSADIIRQQPLITWVTSGPNAFYTHGLAEGTLIQLESNGQGEIKFIYNRHGKTVYTAIETNGEVGNLDHIATLYSRVSIMATPVSSQEHEKPKSSKDAPRNMTVGDVMRAIDVDELVSMILDKSSPLSYQISKSFVCPERRRKEALIHATVSYLQNVQPKETGILMQGFGLKSLQTGRICGHLVTSTLADIANAHIEFEERYYGGLSPVQRNLKFAQDIIVNLLAGN